MIKKLFSATAIYAITPQLPKLVSFFMLPILTKHLTPEDYGINGVILAYVAAFGALKDLGFGVVLTRSFFKQPRHYMFTWKRVHGIVQVWSPIYGLMLIPLIYIITPEIAYNNIIWIIVCIVIPIMFFDPVTAIGRLYYQLNKRPVSFVTVGLISSFTAITVNYFTIVHLHLGYLGFLLGAAISSFSSFIVYAFLVYYRIKLLPSLRISWKWLKRNLLITLPLIPHLYAGYFLNISDRVLLDYFEVPIKEIGMYAFAYSIGIYFSILSKSIQMAGNPYYMEYYKEESKNGDNKARYITYIMQGSLLLIAFMICLWIKEIFTFIARNDELKNSYYYAIPIVMGYTYFPSYNYNGLKIWYTGNTRRLLKISVVSAIISVALNIILIPAYGIAGAAATTFVSFMYMGYGGYLFPSMRKEFKVRYYGGVWLILTVILTLLALVANQYSIITKGAITLSILMMVLLTVTRKKQVLSIMSIDY